MQVRSYMDSYEKLHNMNKKTNVREIFSREFSIKCEEQNMDSAISIVDEELPGELLGLTMIPEEGKSVSYGMRATLPYRNSKDNPIVQVVSNLGGRKEVYNVDINKIDTDNATQMEIFALLSYTDKMGITDGGKFGSHQKMENAAVVAKESMSYSSIIKEKVDELYTKLKGGNIEPSYQIGADSYTEKEWDTFLEKYDSIEAALRKLMREENKRREEEALKEKQLKDKELYSVS